MNTPSNTPSRWNPWPVSIVAFFTVAIIGFGIFIAFCNQHPADLVAADYYEQEMRYEHQMEGLQRARASAVTYDGASQTIKLSLVPCPPAGARRGKIQLYRPSATEQDRQEQLAPGADGVQVLDARNLTPGLWKVRVSWSVDKRDYFLDQKLVVGATPSTH